MRPRRSLPFHRGFSGLNVAFPRISCIRLAKWRDIIRHCMSNARFCRGALIRWTLGYMVMLFVIILPVFFAVTSFAYADPVITLSIDDVRHPLLKTAGIQASLTGSKESLLDIQLDEVAIQGKVWRGLRFSCHKFQIDDGLVRCDEGVLTSATSAPLLISFQFSSRHKTLDIKIQTSSSEGRESWTLSAHWGKPSWGGMLTVTNGDISRIAEFLPVGEKEILPTPIQGKG